jgi:hypothetical protein
MPPRKRYRCRYCGLLFNAWLPWAKDPNGVLLFGHLSLHHADQMGPYRVRLAAGDETSPPWRPRRMRWSRKARRREVTRDQET